MLYFIRLTRPRGHSVLPVVDVAVPPLQLMDAITCVVDVATTSNDRLLWSDANASSNGAAMSSVRHANERRMFIRASDKPTLCMSAHAILVLSQ